MGGAASATASVLLAPEAISCAALLYVSANCGVMWASYTGNRLPAVLEKDSEGQRSLVTRTAIAPIRWASRAIQATILNLIKETPYDLVSPSGTTPVYVGRFPRSLEELPADVGLVLDLTTEFEADPDIVVSKDYYSVQCLDEILPSAAHLGPALEKIVKCETGIYVHCAYGHGRSSVSAALVLALRGDFATWREAFAYIKTVRPRVNFNAKQSKIADEIHV